MKLKYFLLVFSLSMVFQITMAQNKTNITGKVTDAKGELLPGVSVSLKGTTTGVVTDINGQYSINANTDNPILIVSYMGFITQELAVNNRKVVNVALLDDTKSLDEVVVTGYQSERKKDLTGSVAVVDVNDLKKQAVANPMKALQG